MQRLATLALGAPAAVVLWFLFLAAPAAVQPYLDPPVITAVEGRDTSIYLMWSAVEGATRYQVGWDLVDGSAAGGHEVVPGGGTSRSHTITGLENGKTYYVWVWGDGGEGGIEGTPSDVRTVTPTDRTAAPTIRTAPPAVDLTCHGYDEGATRAYNCIPEPSQQHHYADVRSSRWVGLRCGQHRRVSRRSDRLPDPVP